MKTIAVILTLLVVALACFVLGRKPRISDWPFYSPRDTLVLTTTHVIKKKEPIMFVLHDSYDGVWKFFSNSITSEKDNMFVSLEEIIILDPSIAKLADLPLGYSAFRPQKESSWIRKPSPSQ